MVKKETLKEQSISKKKVADEKLRKFKLDKVSEKYTQKHEKI